MSDNPATWVAIDGGRWHAVIPCAVLPDHLAEPLCGRLLLGADGLYRSWTRFTRHRPDHNEICGHCLRAEEAS